MSDAKIPALIVSGYLGSGKTTLVQHLLDDAQAKGIRLAIISNEFGDTGIDRALLDAGEEGFVELDGGCVCCRLSDALGETLETILTQVRPDRVVLECSGVALPGEILVQFWRPPISGFVSRTLVAVLVDAERAADGCDDETFVEQLEAADIVLINKRDLVDDARYARAEAHVDELSGGRPTFACERARVDHALLFPDAPQTQAPNPDRVARPHVHEQFGTREVRFDGIQDADEVIQAIAATRVIRAKGFIRTVDGVRVVQGVGARIEVTEPRTPVPDDLVGRVVLIDRESA